MNNEKKELVSKKCWKKITSSVLQKSRTSTAEENTVEVEQTQDLSTEAQQSVKVLKQDDDFQPHDHLVTVPVVQAPEMANPILLEDNHVLNFEEQEMNSSFEVKNLGDLGDVDLANTLAQESGKFTTVEDDQQSNE